MSLVVFDRQRREPSEADELLTEDTIGDGSADSTTR